MSAVDTAKMSLILTSRIHTKTPVTTLSSTPSSAGTSSGESDPKLRYISKYQYKLFLMLLPRAALQLFGARVLTSATCARGTRAKKMMETEEKNKRKIQREQKKMKRKKLQRRELKKELEKPKRLLRNRRIESRRE